MTALAITEAELRRGLSIIRASISAVQKSMAVSLGEQKRVTVPIDCTWEAHGGQNLPGGFTT